MKPPPRRSRRRLVLAIIATAVVAIVAAVLIPVLNGRDPEPAPQAAPTPAATARQNDSTPSPDSPAQPPAGYQLYRDPAGWSVAVPVGWTAAQDGTTVTFTGGGRVLRVTMRPDPPQDPYEAQLALQPVIEAGTPGYDFIRIASVTYRGWATSDWEYRAGTTTRTHSLIRSTVTGPSTVFDITWTCQDARWVADKRFFDTAVRTFDPGA
ncbi:MAG TPA: hypothetical protein VGP36_16830 [Mycobacteriales bacterium]|jgi:hypothetical protein|nr:hypothetical protein [Mycobacteriales bacterium]